MTSTTTTAATRMLGQQKRGTTLFGVISACPDHEKRRADGNRQRTTRCR
jgi:hypothetical protein